MSGDWIKFEMSTITKPEVLKIARILGMDRHAVVGRLIVFWSWCDANSVDGVVDATVDATVDALVDAPGFSRALCTVGWLQIDAENEQITVPKFGRHNGKSAKKRVLKSERQAKWRATKTVDASVDAPASTREEKRREDIKKDSSSKSPKKGSAEKWQPPQNLNAAAWDEFEAHRRDIRKPLSNQARTKNANLMTQYDEGTQQRMVDATIANHWAGLFPPKDNGAWQQKETSAEKFMRILKNA